MDFVSNQIPAAFIPYRTVGYSCGILCPDGNIFFIPKNQTTLLKENIYTRIEDNTTVVLTEEEASNNGWETAVLAPNGKIYCPPSQSTSFLIIDPTTNELDTTTIVIPGLSDIDTKWAGSCITPNGKMYCTPVNETRVLVVDTNTNVYDLTTFVLDRGGYYSCCYVPNFNRIYSPPGRLSTTNILTINLNTDTADTTSVKLSGVYESIVLATNGRLYCAPFTLPVVSGSIGIIIPSAISTTTNSTTLLLPNGNASLNYNYYYRGLMSSPDGNVYYMPGSSTMVIVIRTSLNRLDSTSLGSKFYEYSIEEPL